MIGKRKRDTSVVSRSTKAEDEDTPTTTDVSSPHDVFRRYFEAQFQPLELPGGPVAGNTEDKESAEDEDEDEDESADSDSDSGSEWSGISETKTGSNKVEVIEHKGSSIKADDITDKKARKAFMVCTTASGVWKLN